MPVMHNLSSANSFRSQYGPWALITGASSGIGRAIATRLAEAQVNIVLVARSRDVMEEIASELIATAKIDCRVVAADLATAAGVDSVVTMNRDLDVGLFVASAGFGTSGSFLSSPLGT